MSVDQIAKMRLCEARLQQEALRIHILKNKAWRKRTYGVDKKSAVDYAHLEMTGEMTDPTSKGRNYFNRPSAPGHTGFIHTSGYDNNESKQHEDVHCEEEHHDKFERDEVIWSNMYSLLHLPDEEVALKGGSDGVKIAKSPDEEEEGKLSRSPLSVMLFEQGMEGY